MQSQFNNKWERKIWTIIYSFLRKIFKNLLCTCLHFAKYTGTQSHIKQLLSSLSFRKPGREAGPPRVIPQGRKCFIGKQIEDASQEGRQGTKKEKKKKNEAKERHKRDCSENRETILVKKMSALLKSDTFNILYNTSKICLFF